ncbi:hypothetical protein H8356DRAFT_1028510 [Neocallimastix lanati (nom. inval.)]|uniref:Uncharacterized protein n=1 Tax=Neocallimastix californiae TaxID=1754190 RepID=A0A1Y2F8B9_9FUNG|nr:hypothetical protein H8356DRAFT_1028510 [Neocallimastix sp. JGI-2020a]ORY80113.1 hypothetical protein LY90DRAFT_500493 [Neocallimastix californiae]|eukprot:ORY80113.1 hypothetical protein LY90DRAFT_500493 [Neocallimastix californiae]
MQLGELQFGEMPHFFNTPHAFKKIGEMQFGEMPHTLKGKLGFGGLILGAASFDFYIYNNESTCEVVRNQSSKLLAESTEYINDSKKFLEPIFDTNKQNVRINDLIKNINDSTINGKEYFYI